VMFSQGVRMILAGDEIGRSQRGNNNAYCQDNEISWIDWNIGEKEQEMFDFTRELIAIMQTNPVLRRRHFFSGHEGLAQGESDVVWIRGDGQEMTEADWEDQSSQTLGMLMPGRSGDEIDDRGRAVGGQSLLWLLNSGGSPRSYSMPKMERPGLWEQLFSTARPGQRAVPNAAINLAGHSTILLRHSENPLR
jgi:isoamylase